MRFNYEGFLDFTLEKRGTNEIYFEIHSQSKLITNGTWDRDTFYEFKASNGFEIESCDGVELGYRTIFLRGTSDSNSKYETFHLVEDETESERDTHYDRALCALMEFASHFGYTLQGRYREPEQLTLWD